jgi:hypothetical protein
MSALAAAAVPAGSCGGTTTGDHSRPRDEARDVIELVNKMVETNRRVGTSEFLAEVIDAASVRALATPWAVPIDAYVRPFEAVEGESGSERTRRWNLANAADDLRRKRLVDYENRARRVKADIATRAEVEYRRDLDRGGDDDPGGTTNLLAHASDPARRVPTRQRWHVRRALDLIVQPEHSGRSFVLKTPGGDVGIKLVKSPPPPTSRPGKLRSFGSRSDLPEGFAWITERVDLNAPATLHATFQLDTGQDYLDPAVAASLRNAVLQHARGVLGPELTAEAAAQDECHFGCGPGEATLEAWTARGVTEVMSFFRETGSAEGAMLLLEAWLNVPLDDVSAKRKGQALDWAKLTTLKRVGECAREALSARDDAAAAAAAAPAVVAAAHARADAATARGVPLSSHDHDRLQAISRSDWDNGVMRFGTLCELEPPPGGFAFGTDGNGHVDAAKVLHEDFDCAAQRKKRRTDESARPREGDDSPPRSSTRCLGADAAARVAERDAPPRGTAGLTGTFVALEYANAILDRLDHAGTKRRSQCSDGWAAWVLRADQSSLSWRSLSGAGQERALVASAGRALKKHAEGMLGSSAWEYPREIPRVTIGMLTPLVFEDGSTREAGEEHELTVVVRGDGFGSFMQALLSNQVRKPRRPVTRVQALGLSPGWVEVPDPLRGGCAVVPAHTVPEARAAPAWAEQRRLKTAGMSEEQECRAVAAAEALERRLKDAGWSEEQVLLEMEQRRLGIAGYDVKVGGYTEELEAYGTYTGSRVHLPGCVVWQRGVGEDDALWRLPVSTGATVVFRHVDEQGRTESRAGRLGRLEERGGLFPGSKLASAPCCPPKPARPLTSAHSRPTPFVLFAVSVLVVCCSSEWRVCHAGAISKWPEEERVVVWRSDIIARLS